MRLSLRLPMQLALASAGSCMLMAAAPVSAQTCQFLAPVGGNGVTNIGAVAFYRCSLTNVTMGTNVTSSNAALPVPR